MKKSLKIVLHAVFWLYFFGWKELAGALFFGKTKYNIDYFLDPFMISHYILFPLTFYFNYFFIMPRFYKNRQIGKTWLAWILLLFAFITVRYLVQEVWFWHWLGIKNYFDGTTLAYYAFDNLYYGGILIVMSTLFWFIEDNVQSQNERMVLLEEKKAAQLAFLKNQVNPHFIFNTLNNIYSLVSSKSDQALPSIEKLSQLMRYMYKESDATLVSLQDEMAYIDSFIDLQTIRFSNKESVVYQFDGIIGTQKIAPLLLIPFIENMFKHGILNQVDKPLKIMITLSNGVLHLTTSNYVNTFHKDLSSGIGLANVKKRLQLLYPDKHVLQIEANDITYTTQLQITL
jgi:two-component system, LytTR family, sensor kinase